MYVRLSYIADQHDFIKEKALTGPIVLPSEYGEQKNLTASFPALLSNIDLNNLDHLTEFIDREVSRIMMNGTCEFKGIMIDNGAAKSPAGLVQFINYCAHTGHVPSISPSSRAFRGMGNGVNKSLGITTIRMPIGPLLTIEFKVELVNNDVPIMFGLEHH